MAENSGEGAAGVARNTGMRIIRIIAPVVVGQLLLTPASALAESATADDGTAFCTLHLGTVTLAGRQIALPSVTYPCP